MNLLKKFVLCQLQTWKTNYYYKEKDYTQCFSFIVSLKQIKIKIISSIF
jgi:hypothetical protein